MRRLRRLLPCLTGPRKRCRRNDWRNGSAKAAGLSIFDKQSNIRSEWEIGLFPEGSDEKSAALGSLELGASECAELGEVPWTKVGHLMLLPMRPQVFDGIELGCVGRQKLQLNIATFGVDVIADQAATMGLQTIPNDKEFAAGQLAAEIFEESDELGSANRAVDELEVDIPEGDAGHRGELVPSEAILQDGRLASGCPGSNAVRPLAHTGLIYENDGPALSDAAFFSVGQRFVFQWRMACSSRLMARPLDRWQEKFNPLRNRHTPNSEYRLPLIFSMSLPTRESIHRSVAYPCTRAPASSATTNRFFSASVSCGGRPVRGALRSARRPFAASACSHRHTDVRLTLSRRATSAGLVPRRSKRAPSKRRASSFARSRFLLMTASLPSKTPGSDVGVCYSVYQGSIGDPLQRAGTGRSDQHSFAGRAGQARRGAQGLSHQRCGGGADDEVSGRLSTSRPPLTERQGTSRQALVNATGDHSHRAASVARL